MNRLRERYEKEVVPALKKEFGYTNVMAVPKIEKVVVNMGLGEATSNAKIIEVGSAELASITGQKPCRAPRKKSIAAFQSSARGSRSARASRCAASGCTSFSTA
jgi:large subunit ribosomal protein L5